jgi:hypothetical protein
MVRNQARTQKRQRRSLSYRRPSSGRTARTQLPQVCHQRHFVERLDIERLFQSKLRRNVRKELLDGGSANNSQHLRHVSVSMGNVSHGCPWLWMLTDEAWARLKTPKPIGMQGVGSGSVAG